MFEGGLTRQEAIKVARDMEGIENDHIRLPAHELGLVRLAQRTVGKWLVAPNGQLMSFDLKEIDVVRDWMGIEKSEALIDGLGIIERAALKVLRETS